MKLLILAYDFPPLISIGGLRPYSWYKYLADFGVNVTVITRDWQYDETTVKNNSQSPAHGSSAAIELSNARTLIKVRFAPGLKEFIATKLNANKFRTIGRAITYLFSFAEFLSTKFDSKAALYYEADKLLQQEKFDFIIATGKPFILFRYSALLSKKYHTTWIADYRDSWTLNYRQSDYSLDLLSLILNNFYKIMERKYVSTARIITTVAPTYLDVMPLFVARDKIKIVYNGYDDDVEKAVEGLLPSKTKFVISYAGHIYPMQLLEPFLEAVCIFLKENQILPEEFEIHFWGVKQDSGTVGRIMNYNVLLQKYVHLHDKTDYFDVMKKISGSHILLLLASNSDTWLNAKLFDYLVPKRPVLMIGKNTNIMSRILAETNGGLVVNHAVAAANYITAQFKMYKDSMPHKTVNYQQYSRKNQAKKLYMILKNLIE